MFYVTMTDNFLSGWGEAAGKTAKLVVACETQEQADIIATAARQRRDMTAIRKTRNCPRFRRDAYQVSQKHWDDLGGMWKEAV